MRILRQCKTQLGRGEMRPQHLLSLSDPADCHHKKRAQDSIS